ncbi:hypothetical protein ACH5RR_006303 [Cinchona calisaya]|uniref:Uncharacterized protein n=1 Tax=Cinchona calisaya TaxID=153742 RepID=A0ABD3ANV4_9GENT
MGSQRNWHLMGDGLLLNIAVTTTPLEDHVCQLENALHYFLRIFFSCFSILFFSSDIMIELYSSFVRRVDPVATDTFEIDDAEEKEKSCIPPPSPSILMIDDLVLSSKMLNIFLG